jgi:Carboxypeptidase regulatory-like domain
MLVHLNLPRYLGLFLVLLCQSSGCWLSAQSGNATLLGTVADSTGAVIPGATLVIIAASGQTTTVTTHELGAYHSNNLNPGTYIVIGSAPGFAASSPKSFTLAAGHAAQYNVVLKIQIDQQQVRVDAGALTVDTDPDNNANAIDLKGKELDALSDDPDELQDEQQALAGPAAGPNGGQIYIDGFTGGQIPPKSSIREIRINQNPFSAEFDRLGYGRIEIFTKPGTDKLHGQIESRGNESIFNSQDPILNANLTPGEAKLLFLQFEWERRRAD